MIISVCAWCKCSYDHLGDKIALLTEQEYSKVISHGICQECSKTMKAELVKKT